MNEPNPPPPPGEDSVQSMHRRHQDIMNDPVVLSAFAWLGQPAGA